MPRVVAFGTRPRGSVTYEKDTDIVITLNKKIVIYCSKG